MAQARVKRELEDRYDPVPHTKADIERMMQHSAFRAAYEALDEEFTALDALLTARKEAVSRRRRSRSAWAPPRPWYPAWNRRSRAKSIRPRWRRCENTQRHAENP